MEGLLTGASGALALEAALLLAREHDVMVGGETWPQVREARRRAAAADARSGAIELDPIDLAHAARSDRTSSS